MDDEYSGGLVSEHLWMSEDQSEDDEDCFASCMEGRLVLETDRLLWE
jgi:hypothetical protein